MLARWRQRSRPGSWAWQNWWGSAQPVSVARRRRLARGSGAAGSSSARYRCASAADFGEEISPKPARFPSFSSSAWVWRSSLPSAPDLESHWGRVGALVLRHEVVHLSSDDREPDRRSRVLPGVDAVFEASWHFSSSAAFVAGVGSELAFGHTDILVKGREVTEIPPLRGLAELGIQAKF